MFSPSVVRFCETVSLGEKKALDPFGHLQTSLRLQVFPAIFFVSPRLACYDSAEFYFTVFNMNLDRKFTAMHKETTIGLCKGPRENLLKGTVQRDLRGV
jgi:hypothetical protein